MKKIAGRYAKSETQIALRWLIEQDNVVAIPRSSNEQRLSANLEVFDFSLSQEEHEIIGTMSHPSRRFVDWHYSPVWD